ncbi:ATP-dependent DNA helicase RecG [Candidatus Roizmanbacteria bacterium]|nr:ATP-dependent DNA helicase RecG [Candidatus Roizmanbacteria bacterium]
MFSTAIDALPSTSPLTIKRFKTLGINTYYDLLNYIPFRYENYPVAPSIASLQSADTVTVVGTILKTETGYPRRGLTIQKVTVTDSTGELELSWFNQPYLLKLFKPGTELAAAGEVKRMGRKVFMTPNEYELPIPGRPFKHTGRIIPIYPEKLGLSSKLIRDKMQKILDLLDTEPIEWLPDEILTGNALLPAHEAYRAIHFPKTKTEILKARERLSFDELFTMQLSTALIRASWKKEEVTFPFTINGEVHKKIDAFIAHLPFPLTHAQQRCINEILSDLSLQSPMNRFLQGDVGSGKTVVAAIAAYAAYLNEQKTLVMVPTEILAEQHFANFTSFFEPYGISVGLQTGSKKQTDENSQIIVGTHALIQKGVSFENIGLVIIDEQHRFGVSQRAELKNKGISPHLLTMTATPIPRTVALTLYGELDMSVIDEMPKGRIPIKTFLVRPEKRENGYEWIKNEIKNNKTQVFIICPFVEESTEETMATVKAATKEFERLKKDVFSQFRVGLIHGKMKAKEKDEVMLDFKAKKYDILVATTVIEVGIDVPNATIMIIEGAERFGLAQLHQLRGRVGRGSAQSYCYLYTSEDSPANFHRLIFFTRTINGMELAEYDYKQRGAGDIFGTRQSGLADTKIADLTNFALISQTQQVVSQFLQNHTVDDFPLIKEHLAKYRIDQIARD